MYMQWVYYHGTLAALFNNEALLSNTVKELYTRPVHKLPYGDRVPKLSTLI